MGDNDPSIAPSVTGILHCLQLLAEEAASLHLYRTFCAIENAVETAASESGTELPGVSVHTMPARLLRH